MKVLLATPPAYIGNIDRHFIQAGSRWAFSLQLPKGGHDDHYLPYPFQLGYATALLERDTDADIRSLDACALDFDEHEFIDFVKSYAPDFLFIEIPTVSFPLVMGILKEIKSLVDCEIGIGGGHITALTEGVMENYSFIDYGLVGEYEIALKELVLALMEDDSKERIKDIGGLALRCGDKILLNKKEKLIRDLDDLPFPERESLPIEKYRDFVVAGEPSIQMRSSRGCPSSCIFCLRRHVIFGSPKYERRDPSKVVDEMELCKKKYDAKQIYFDDDTMTRNRKHVREICQEILDRGLDIPWTCMGDVTLDKQTLELMHKSGCIGVKFGVETANQDVLKNAGKDFLSTLGMKQVERFVKNCQELGLWTRAAYTLGLPKDTKESILATIRFAKDLDTDGLNFSITTPLPGTPFFKIAKENDWLVTLDWTKYDGANYAVVSYPHLKKEEIEELYRYACQVQHSVREQSSSMERHLRNPLRATKKLRNIGIRRGMKTLIESLKKKI